MAFLQPCPPRRQRTVWTGIVAAWLLIGGGCVNFPAIDSIVVGPPVDPPVFSAEPQTSDYVDDAPAIEVVGGGVLEAAEPVATVETAERSEAVESDGNDHNPVALASHTTSVPSVPVDETVLSFADQTQDWHVDQRVSFSATNTTIHSILGLIAEEHGLNVITSGDVDQKITVNLKDVLLADALNSILPANGLTWTRHHNIIVVSNISGEVKGPAMLQGREVRVVSLNYIAAADAEKIVKGLLSPVGQVFINESATTDQRRTQEQVVVEDLPMYLQRVEQYLAQADRPPRQVLVEAHVLQVELKDNFRHGIDLKNVLRIAGSPVTLEGKGFTNGGEPSGLLRLSGTDLNGVIEAIQSTTDSKTLASPKVTVLNGQEARIQVGGQIGYLLTTTTQTSTLQSVNFLDVGVILQVTPVITDDNQIMMQVRPEVSTGRINANTNLPESETTQLETRIMLADGEAMLIGGLIKETNIDSRGKVPFLGDAWLIGHLFRRSEIKRERSEIIIALLPRILPDVPGCRNLNPVEVDQASTPLFHGPLHPNDRRHWEPPLEQ
jgi:type II secretory pathway component GspD/PulD (secretin)